jgi:ABC-type oligopeptide transport system substrate-binding subunit
MHGQPALPADFSRLPHADPQATKGGHLALAYQRTFDNLNPYNLSAGSTAQGLIGNVFQSLMLRSLDEPFTLYGLIAQSIETDDARSYVIFRLDPRARFSDSVPVKEGRQRRNCYWNVASNVERGRRLPSRLYRAHVIRSPEDSPIPIPGETAAGRSLA